MHGVVVAANRRHPNPRQTAKVRGRIEKGDVAQLDDDRRVPTDHQPHEEPGICSRWSADTGPDDRGVPVELAGLHEPGAVAASGVAQTATE